MQYAKTLNTEKRSNTIKVIIIVIVFLSLVLFFRRYIGYSTVETAKLNTAPVLEPFNKTQTAIIGEKFSFKINAYDLDGDKLTFSDDTDLFDINPDIGLIEFIPREIDRGLRRIVIIVIDPSANIDYKLLELNITDKG